MFLQVLFGHFHTNTNSFVVYNHNLAKKVSHSYNYTSSIGSIEIAISIHSSFNPSHIQNILVCTANERARYITIATTYIHCTSLLEKNCGEVDWKLPCVLGFPLWLAQLLISCNFVIWEGKKTPSSCHIQGNFIRRWNLCNSYTTHANQWSRQKTWKTKRIIKCDLIGTENCCHELARVIGRGAKACKELSTCNESLNSLLTLFMDLMDRYKACCVCICVCMCVCD